MLRVGLTGGYASGKSFVARNLASLGCHVIYADALGHEVLKPGGEAYEPVLSLYGRQILTTDGLIDRKVLASIVFANPELLQKLNAIVHPAVFRLEEASMRAFEKTNPQGVAVLEAAILIEAGGDRAWDKLIVTTCGLETQIARAVERDHITRQEALQRIERQLPDADRVRLADYVIHTDGNREDTVKQVSRIYSELRQLAEASSH